MSSLDSVLPVLERGFEQTLDELVALARIPSVSADGFDPREVERSAEHVAQLLGKCGLERVELLRLPGAHPYVVGEWLRAGDTAPTVLIYAHHDVQPPGRLDRWETPAFEPTLRADERPYGRGVVDDVPALLLGLEDPVCHAHGENESLHLGDFRKAARAAVHLLAELGKALSA